MEQRTPVAIRHTSGVFLNPHEHAIATILIVDDLATNRRLLATLLGYHRYRTHEAANGHEALAAVRAAPPDLVITDVLMPVMDGYELVKQLRADRTTAHIPVVFHTAHYAAREARALALSSGVADFLMKPASSADVLRTVQRVLAGQIKSGTGTVVPLPTEFDHEHLRLLTNKLSEKAGDLRTANARLRALINIGLELASERDPDRLLQSVCVAARELFGATYVTLGILDRNDRTVQRLVLHGAEAAGWLRIGERITGILAAVVDERKTVRVDSSRASNAEWNFPPPHPEVRAFVAAPLGSPAHVYGWICLVNNEGKAFVEEDEELVGALAGQVARIYDNGYLYAVAQKRSEELEREMLERNRVEAALRQQRDRTQGYLDTADVILLALDLEGRITLANRYACSLLGWTGGELVGRDWIETCLPDRVRERVRKKFQHLVGGDLSIVESPVQTRSGEERLIEWRNTILRDDQGAVIGTLSSGTDITTRHEAAEALRIAEERMRFALQNAEVGIWDMDYTTGVLRWSETLEAQYGLQPGTFPGTLGAFVEHIHPDDQKGVLDTIEKAMVSGADFSLHHRSIGPDGAIRWLNGAGRIQLAENGDPVRGVGISLDVTERRAMEEQYHHGQKMEAIGRLAGGVAHDFNNLLTVILGYSELLLQDLAADDPRRIDMAEIQRAGASAAGLTRQLLAFSRKQVIQLSLVNLNVVVNDMRSMIQRLIAEDITVDLVLAPDLAPVKADRGQVEQTILNLAVNARDAMPMGGRLRIETANIDLPDTDAKPHLALLPGRYVVLTVSDTGIGMTLQVQARLFEPFFTTKDLGKGTGLGLATVHGMAERSGGKVDFCSELGAGTSFMVYFPRADSAESVVLPAPASAAPRAAGKTVLVVDDADALRELASRLLQRQGHTVLLAANAEEARAVFERNASIDVLLTDVVMPGTNGLELTRRLVAEHPGLKVIYMSGYTEDAILQRGVLNSEVAFIEKPFTADALGRKISALFDPHAVGAEGRGARIGNP